MLQPRSAVEIWRLVERQHGVVSRQQLLAVGLSPSAIKHRLARGRRDEHTVTALNGIPVATIPSVVIDMALRWPRRHREAAVNQAAARTAR